MVAAAIRTIFAQPDAAAVGAQFARIVDMLKGQFAEVAAMLVDAREDLLASATCRRPRWRGCDRSRHRRCRRPHRGESAWRAENRPLRAPVRHATRSPGTKGADDRLVQPAVPIPTMLGAGGHFSTTRRDVIPASGYRPHDFPCSHATPRTIAAPGSGLRWFFPKLGGVAPIEASSGMSLNTGSTAPGTAS